MSSQLSDLTEYDYFSFPNISPPRLEMDGVTDTTTNIDTRRPKHFDMHLHEDLILKRVKFMPAGMDIRRHLCDAVDEASLTLGEPPSDFLPTKDIVKGWESGRIVSDEQDVVDFYQRTTADLALDLASGLALGCPGKWPELLQIGQNNPRKSKGGAISDAFLSMNRLRIDQAKKESGALGKELIERLEDDHISNRTLAVWEFKNLKAGGADVMKEIAGIATRERPFHWTSCDKESKCTNSSQHFDANGRVRVTGDRRGFDAHWGTLQPTTCDNHAPAPAESQSQSQSQDDYTTTNSSLADPSHMDKNESKATYILQQVWAQAVKNDTTYLVIHSGNHEFIGMRHRSSQTLYLSQLFTPSESGDCGGYLKLHTGLYLSAFKDAASRALLMRQAQAATPSAVPESWTRNYRFVRAKRPRKENLVVGPNVCDCEDMVAIFDRQDQFAVADPDSLIFSGLGPTMSLTFKKCGARSPLYSTHPDLHLKLEEKYGNCYRGQLSGFPYDDIASVQRVVIKTASRAEQQNKLRHEYDVYEDLAAAPLFPFGFLQPVYLFEAEYKGEDMLALVMPDAGDRFRSEKYPTHVKKNIKVVFQQILKRLHNLDYLHLDVDEKKLLIDDELKLSIIGLGQATQMEDDDADIHRWDRAVGNEDREFEHLWR
ncbi:hypothetical protein DFH06DRAFT_1202907 [Mycena polygramma]|nr:hypothetical protein DFH06DRAFT_1202907 [Mycena polygramma]